MITRNYIISILAIISISCESKLDRLTGHWHSFDKLENEYYRTLDIGDSITVINKYCIDGMVYETFPINFDGSIILPTGNIEFTNEFELYQDTLIIDSLFKYFMTNDLDCRENDLFCNRRVSIDLKSSSRSTKPLDSEVMSNLRFINIGKLKPEFRHLYKVKPDSFFIQISDVYVEFRHIEEFASRSYTENHQIAINADKSLPQYYMDSIIHRITSVDSKRKVFITSFNVQENRLEFEEY